MMHIIHSIMTCIPTTLSVHNTPYVGYMYVLVPIVLHIFSSRRVIYNIERVLAATGLIMVHYKIKYAFSGS